MTATGAATDPDSTPEDERLAALIDAWPDLPEAVRTGIAAMVAASSSKGAEHG